MKMAHYYYFRKLDKMPSLLKVIEIASSFLLLPVFLILNIVLSSREQSHRSSLSESYVRGQWLVTGLSLKPCFLNIINLYRLNWCPFSVMRKANLSEIYSLERKLDQTLLWIVWRVWLPGPGAAGCDSGKECFLCKA